MDNTLPLSETERKEILSLLQNVPEEDLPRSAPGTGEWDPHRTVLYDGVPDPLEHRHGYTYLGRYPSVPSTRIRDSILGVGLETLDRDTFDPAPVIPLLGKTGIRYARCQTGWIKCEKERGVYDFAWLDKIADSLIANGITPWFSISFGNPLYTPNEAFAEAWRTHENYMDIPGWARGYVGEMPLYHGPDAVRGYLNYVEALVTHFRGRVSMYEVWNEPEGFSRFHGENMTKKLGVRRSAEDYTELVRLTAEAVRKILPDATIISVTASFGSAYIQELGRAGLGRYIDAHSFHSYEPTPESFLSERVAHLRHVLSVPGRELRIMQGESGRASGLSMKRCTKPSEYNQAKFIARRYFADAAEGLMMSSYFTASDFKNYYWDGSDQYYGIINGSGTPKLGYYTVAGCAALFDGLHRDEGMFARVLPAAEIFAETADYSARSAAFRKNGVPLFAVWDPAFVDLYHEPRSCRLWAVTDEPDELRDPVLIDPIRRNVYAARAQMTPDSKDARLIVENFPLNDYPLILTDLSVFRDLL